MMLRTHLHIWLLSAADCSVVEKNKEKKDTVAMELVALQQEQVD